MIDRWDVHKGTLLDTLRADSRPIQLLAYSTDAALVAAIDRQNVVRIWDTSTGATGPVGANSIPIQLTRPGDRIEEPGFLAFGGHGAWLASGAGTLQTWDLDLNSLELKMCSVLRVQTQQGSGSAAPVWTKVGLCAQP